MNLREKGEEGDKVDSFRFRRVLRISIIFVWGVGVVGVWEMRGVGYNEGS